MTFESEILRELKFFKRKLSSLPFLSRIENFSLTCSSDKRSFTIDFAPENINVYHLFRQPQKLISTIKSKLGLNKKVFARKCSVSKISNKTAAEFLDKFHLMNSTSCADSYGLFYEEELVAVATFSKGRKMNRLPAEKRSFELIRFCTAEGTTVTGGLTRLLKYFCKEKKAGDIMTYVDRQFSEGEAFMKAGFKKHSETEPSYFLLEKKSFHLTSLKSKGKEHQDPEYLILKNAGNIKMIFQPEY